MNRTVNPTPLAQRAFSGRGFRAARRPLVLALPVFLLCLGGCDEDSPADVEEELTGPLALSGDFGSNYDGFVRITGEGDVYYSWYGAPSMTITQYNNSEGWLVGQNGAGDAWNPDKWSRVDWAPIEDGGYWWCQTAFDAATEEAAMAVAAADATDPATSGCGGFAWTRLDAGQGGFSLNGSWVDGFDGTHTISSTVWTMGGATFDIVEYANADEWAVAQNGSDNEYSPDLWSRFDWTWEDGQFWFCQTVFDGATEEAARNASPANPTDPTTTGCGEFPWSSLAAVPADAS